MEGNKKSSSLKRKRTTSFPLEGKKWKTIDAKLGDDVLMFEELDDDGSFEFVLDSTNVKSETVKKDKKVSKKKAKKVKQENLVEESEDPKPNLDVVTITPWDQYGINSNVIKGILEMGFKEPTEIQRRSLHATIRDRKDIIGAAETGSGKTLAFGIPILHFLSERKESEGNENKLGALIMTPTRELAIQIQKHLTEAAKYTNLSVISIVGGLSPYKQTRQLSNNPDIIIATPGRLWQLMNQHPVSSII
jgi:ATP-dependent RNA helicase DDX24/MAK5